jgi:hypothetical protein
MFRAYQLSLSRSLSLLTTNYLPSAVLHAIRRVSPQATHFAHTCFHFRLWLLTTNVLTCTQPTAVRLPRQLVSHIPPSRSLQLLTTNVLLNHSSTAAFAVNTTVRTYLPSLSLPLLTTNVLPLLAYLFSLSHRLLTTDVRYY